MPKRKREFMLDIWGGPRKKASVLSANLRLAKSFFPDRASTTGRDARAARIACATSSETSTCGTSSSGRASQAALPHLNHLRELECRQVHFDRTFLDGLAEFLASTESLTTLTMSHLHIEREDAVVILQGLKRNKTITTLSLNTCILSPVSSRCGFMFADYLRENQTLRTLSVTSRYLKNVIELRLIIRALFHNRTLSELNLIRFSLDNENIQLITRLLGQNKTLRRFHMVGCVWYERAPQCCINSSMQHMENFGNVSSRIRPWLVALTENKTLDELTLDLSCFNSDECRSFFKALASNAFPEEDHRRASPA
ncbi:hypothetical protein MTO96_002171 [Rhipicephalus appendiculatus]